MKGVSRNILFCLLSVLLLSACQHADNIRPLLRENIGQIDNLAIASGTVITDNQQAFDAKLALVDQATQSIDLVYFIFSDDYSSAVLARQLIAASKRGVKIRILVDYVTNYSRLDWFSMLESEGGSNLMVRFYGRPTHNMVKDAAYMTLGCSDAAPRTDRSACSKEKLDQIEQLFKTETINGVSAEAVNISNLSLGESGLFLSGLYGKNIDAMTLAIEQGQNISLDHLVSSENSVSDKQVDGLKKFGQIYWKSRTGPPYQRVYNRVKTAFAFKYYGDALNPVYASFTQFLPAERKNIADAARDWDFFTDYTHHKLLLADEQFFILGGRNVEDSYHMHPNSLSAKYTFMDTDLLVNLSVPDARLRHRFDGLWSFIGTATIDEIRQHTPNDFIANWHWASITCEKSEQLSVCRAKRLQQVELDVEQRIALEKRKLEKHHQTYQDNYQASAEFASGFPAFMLTEGAVGTYFENLPYRATDNNTQRQFGAQYNKEAISNKNIHRYWLDKIEEQCTTADKSPRSIYVYNAYFFPPPNILLAFKSLIDGRYDCRHVTLNIITNSVETTDLVPVNILASHSVKAFVDYYTENFDSKHSATLRYFEYKKKPGAALSLHSKVTLFNDALMIGSANMDVRSYFMDSNNALSISKDSNLIKRYQRHLTDLIENPEKTQFKNTELRNTKIESIIATDRKLLQASLEKYAIQNKLSKEQHQKLIKKMNELTTAAYQLTQRLLATDSAKKQRKISEQFYQLFKTI